MSAKVAAAIKTRFGDAVMDSHAMLGDDTVVLEKTSIVEVCRFLKDSEQLAFDMPIDVTCVDYSQHPDGHPYGSRFVVVYHLRSMKHNHRIRLKVPAGTDDPRVDSVTSVWRGVVWFEREVFDMFGVGFDGHPDLRRILMYPDFVGHPLRKDYPLRGYQPTMDMPTLAGDPVPGVNAISEDEE